MAAVQRQGAELVDVEALRPGRRPRIASAGRALHEPPVERLGLEAPPAARLAREVAAVA